MFPHAFPSEAALTLSRSIAEDKPGTALAGSRTHAAYAMLGYALWCLQGQSDVDNPAEAEVDDTGHPTGAVPASAHAASDPAMPEPDDAPKKRVRRRKKDESGFDADEPEALLSALSDHAKARIKQGGVELPSPVPARVLAEYCLKVIQEAL